MRTVLSSRVALAAAIASVALTLSPGHAAPNLAPNPGFEAAVTPVSAPGQPLLPEGWIFEGAAVLFDHTENEHHSGSRAAGISGSLSGKRRIGLPDPVGFQDNPANIAKDATQFVYSTTPCWRTLLPIAVDGNTNYRLRLWTRQSVVTALPEYGAYTKVRWLDQNNVPLSVSPGPARPWKNGDPTDIPTAWEQISGSMKSPAGARGAVLLLCQADDVWISQVVYDDVEFFKV